MPEFENLLCNCQIKWTAIIKWTTLFLDVADNQKALTFIFKVG